MGRLIKQGHQGADVRAVQDVLNFHVRRLQPLAVDGAFGPLTHARVVEFQKANRLKADGIVGPQTLAKLLEEEQFPISLSLAPPSSSSSTARTFSASNLKPPRVISPRITPFQLPPASTVLVPALTPPGQTVTFVVTTPVRNDPLDPAMKTFLEIMRLLNQLPQDFPFRAKILGAIPKPVIKVGPLELDPVKPMDFGFKWGVKPEFDLLSVKPPVNFVVGASANARYVVKLIGKPASGLPQLGLFVQGDFKGTIDWTSKSAQSQPLLDLRGTFAIGVQGTF